jgi:macrolide transport system ATP-binding/permease protein
VGSLSAGQQRRLALARLLLGGFGTMLVDEPTNHLAPVLVEQLEAALSEFAGTLVMVSHDRALGEWFSTCARRGTSRETRHGARQKTAHGNGAGNWLRYTMRDGALA